MWADESLSAHADSNHIGELFTTGSVEHRYQIIQFLYDKVQLLIAIVLHYQLQEPELNGIVYNYILRRKGLNSKIDYKHKRFFENKQKAPELELAERQLHTAYDTLSMAVLTGKSESIINGLLKEVNGQLAQKEIAVLESFYFLPPMNILDTLYNESVESVVFNMPHDSFLIDYVKYKSLDNWLQGHEEQDVPISERYGVFVLEAFSNDIKFLDIGNADDIDILVKQYISLLATPLSDIQTVQAAGMAIKAKIFDPTSPYLRDKKRLIICPDSNLALMPLESLPSENNNFLVDFYTISYVSSAREVCFSDQQPTVQIMVLL